MFIDDLHRDCFGLMVDHLRAFRWNGWGYVRGLLNEAPYSRPRLRFLGQVSDRVPQQLLTERLIAEAIDVLTLARRASA